MIVTRRSFVHNILLLLVVLQNSSIVTFSKQIQRKLKEEKSHGSLAASAEVANLVSKEYSYTQKQDAYGNNNAGGPSLMFGGILKIIGLDERKVSALAMNSVVFVAQMIFNSVMDKNKPIKDINIPSGTPLDWVMENQSGYFSNIFKEVANEALPKMIVDTLESASNTNNKEKSCMKQLLCKIQPILRAMQAHIINTNFKEDPKNNSKQSLNNMLMIFSKEDFVKNAHICENMYDNC